MTARDMGYVKTSKLLLVNELLLSILNSGVSRPLLEEAEAC